MEQYASQFMSTKHNNGMKKEDFTIEGSTALKKAFVEDSGCMLEPVSSMVNNLTSSVTDERWLTVVAGEHMAPKHFILPDQYNEALEYVKGFWEEEEQYEEGQLIVITDKADKHFGKIVTISEILYNNVGIVYELDGEYWEQDSGKFRKATPEEIEQAQTKNISVSGAIDVRVNADGIFYNTFGITGYLTEMMKWYEELTSPGKRFAGLPYKVKDIIFLEGDGKETKLSDWQKVWEQYEKLKL